nr:PREDICTED: prostate stem cell antigen-like [Lepisosteus oculatus]
MKIILVPLLVVCLDVTSVVALDCYVCPSTSTNEDCNKNTQSCQAPLDTCMTTVVTSGNIKAIVKACMSKTTCSAAASGSSVDSSGNRNQVTCCQTNLCNANGSTTARLSSLLLALPLSSLFLLSKT